MNREDISREISIIEGLLMLIELNRANSKITHFDDEGNQIDDEGNQKTRYLENTKRELFYSILGLYRKKLYLEDIDIYSPLYNYYGHPQIHLSSELCVFLGDIGLSMNGNTIGIDIARMVMIYLQKIKRFIINTDSELMIHEEYMERLENTEFYKYLECDKNSDPLIDPLDTLVEFYINELNFKLSNLNWTKGISDKNSFNLATDYDKYFDNNGQYKYSNSEDKKCLKESTDTSLPADKIESTFNFNTTEEITIGADLIKFLSSLGIDLPSANIDKGLASTIQDFLERYRDSYADFYFKLCKHKRNSSECDYSSILPELGRRMDRTYCYLKELIKSIESSR